MQITLMGGLIRRDMSHENLKAITPHKIPNVAHTGRALASLDFWNTPRFTPHKLTAP